MIPVLETQRLRLREWRDSDLPAFASLMTNQEAARFITPCASQGEAWRKMAYFAGHWQLRGFGMWSIEEKLTRAPVGYCGPYFPIDWPEPEIGWGTYPAHQNRGYATEAALAVRQFAFDTLGWPTAISLIADGNSPSIRVAAKIGAIAEKSANVDGHPCTIYRHNNTNSSHLHSKEKPTWQ